MSVEWDDVEEWRSIPGWDGLYEVSNWGRVRSLDRKVRCQGGVRFCRGRVLTGRMKHRTVQVQLWRGQEAFHTNVGRLVLIAFIGECPDGMQCCHTDGDPFDSSVDNLRWDTPKANQRDSKLHGTKAIGSRHGCAKLTEADVVWIRNQHKKGVGLNELASLFGMTVTPIRRLIQYENWKHV